MTKSKSTLQNLFQLFGRIPFPKTNQNNNTEMIGRWNLDYDNTVQSRKVYWANMDNCGCCDQNLVIKVTRTDSDQNDSEEYILPYVM